MEQVFVKRKLATGDTELLRADVISGNANVLRVKVEGERNIREVEACNTVSIESVMGNGPRIHQNSTITKIYPGRNSLAHRLNK